MKLGPALRPLLKPAGPARKAAAPAAALLLGGCSGGVFDPEGPVAAGNMSITIDALVIMLAIVVPTILLALFMGWWYRASNTKARYLPEWDYSGRIEAIVWAIPILVILFLSGVIIIGSHQLDPRTPLPSKTKPLEVQVVSLDWKWLFIYPDQGVASVNQLVVPAGQPVHFSITSASVMNVFFVPQLGSMIYAMNGMVTELHLQANRPADLWGLSAQFSGDGFSDMNFKVKSLPQDQFQTWAAQTRQGGPKLDQAAYEVLKQQSQHVKPYTYSAVAPDLFKAIATQKIAPGPGPSPAAGGTTVSPRTER
jgi:cytochrome o ubiquinol oxidase subunit II